MSDIKSILGRNRVYGAGININPHIYYRLTVKGTKEGRQVTVKEVFIMGEQTVCSNREQLWMQGVS